jgi:hypothetical protein
MGCFRAFFIVGSAHVLFKENGNRSIGIHALTGLNPDTGRCFTQLQ